MKTFIQVQFLSNKFGKINQISSKNGFNHNYKKCFADFIYVKRFMALVLDNYLAESIFDRVISNYLYLLTMFMLLSYLGIVFFLLILHFMSN